MYGRFFLVFSLMCFSIKHAVFVLQTMSYRRRSLQQILRARRPATTSAKQRIRSVRKNVKGAALCHPVVAIDSFVEDSLDSVRKSDKEEEDRYNLLESTEELELPCRNESVDQMTVCGELDADVNVVTESSHIVSDVVNASVAAAAAAAAVCEQSTVVHNQPVIPPHPSFQTPEPVSAPVTSEADMNEAVSEERATTHSRPQRQSSLPTQTFDGQLNTPATATRKQLSGVDKVCGLAVWHCL